LEPMAKTSSLDSIFISPRTPRTPRVQNGSADSEEIELSLLDEEERLRAAEGLEVAEEEDVYAAKRPMSSKDKRAMVLLCILCKCHLLSLDVL